MRVLLVCLPMTGHFMPLVPLAHALREAGHEVAFASGSNFALEVERQGFRFFAAGMTGEEWGAASREVAPPATWPSWDDFNAAFGAQVFAGTIARRLAGDLPGALRAWPADLIVHEDTAIGAAVAAERLELPHARLMIMASGFTHPVFASIDAPIAALRAHLGLPPASADETLHRHAALYPFPASLHHPSAILPATLHPIRPTLPAPPPREQIPDWIERLRDAGRPVVYATLGTVFNGPGNDAVFKMILAALADEPVQAVLTVGANRDPADFAPPPNVRVERYLPLAAILNRCDLILSHGGSGTLVGGLALGLPQVILPFAADQPQNADRIAALGAGRAIDAAERSAETIRAAVRAVLAEPGFRQQAGRLRDEIDAMPGMDRAIALLEGLATGRANRAPQGMAQTSHAS